MPEINASTTQIVFLDRDTLGGETEIKTPGFPHKMVCHAATPEALAAERIEQAEILVVNKVPISAATLNLACLVRAASAASITAGLGR